MQEMMMQFLPSSVMQIVLAFVMFFLWKKLKQNPWPITILTIIPIVGLFVYVYAQIRVLFIIANRLEALENSDRRSTIVTP